MLINRFPSESKNSGQFYSFPPIYLRKSDRNRFSPIVRSLRRNFTPSHCLFFLWQFLRGFLQICPATHREVHCEGEGFFADIDGVLFFAPKELGNALVVLYGHTRARELGIVGGGGGE